MSPLLCFWLKFPCACRARPRPPLPFSKSTSDLLGGNGLVNIPHCCSWELPITSAWIYSVWYVTPRVGLYHPHSPCSVPDLSVFHSLLEESDVNGFPDNDLLRHLRVVSQDAERCSSVAQQLLNGKRQTRYSCTDTLWTRTRHTQSVNNLGTYQFCILWWDWCGQQCTCVLLGIALVGGKPRTSCL